MIALSEFKAKASIDGPVRRYYAAAFGSIVKPIAVDGIVHLVYFPSTGESLWKDDALYISHSGRITIGKDSDGRMFPSAWDSVIWGEQIVPFLILASRYSSYDISPILKLMRAKEKMFLESFTTEEHRIDDILDAISGEAP